MTKAGSIIALAAVLSLTACAKKAEVPPATPGPESTAMTAASPAGAESAAPAATAGQASGILKLNGALVASYGFTPNCAVRGSNASSMGLSPGYALVMTPTRSTRGGFINSGLSSVIVTDYTKDATYDETSRLSSIPPALELNITTKPGAAQDVISAEKDSSVIVTISNGAKTGSAAFANFSAREGRVSGTITWTCATVQR